MPTKEGYANTTSKALAKRKIKRKKKTNQATSDGDSSSTKQNQQAGSKQHLSKKKKKQQQLKKNKKRKQKEQGRKATSPKVKERGKPKRSEKATTTSGKFRYENLEKAQKRLGWMIPSLGICLYISGGQKAQDVSYRRFARISTYPRLLSYPTSIKSGQIARKYKTGGDRKGTRKQRRLPQLQRRIAPANSPSSIQNTKKLWCR